MTFHLKLILSCFLFFALVAAGCGSSKKAAEGDSLNDGFREAMKMYKKKDYYGAQLELAKLAYTSRATELEDEIQFYTAQSYYMMEQYILAMDAYQTILRNTPNSPFARVANFQIGMCNYQLSPPSQLDQLYTERAIVQFQSYIELFPVPDSAAVASDLEETKKLASASFDDSTRKMQYAELIRRLESKLGQLDTVKLVEKYISTLRLKLARKAYDAAEQYVRLRAFRAATIYYGEVISRFPESEYYEPSILGKIDALMTREKWDEAESEVGRYEERFPENRVRIEVLRRRLLDGRTQTLRAQATIIR
jgi:outer membrane protein assembly factor BamD